MTCYNDLGETTVVVIDDEGLKGVWCTGRCLGDLHALSFIREVEDSVIQTIESRTKRPEE